MARRDPPSIEEIRVVRGFAAPGASATTLGSTVFVRRGVELTPRLRRHEYEHVLQFARHGRVGFMLRYVADYLRWRLRGRGHWAAYRRLRFEVQAEWRARRELGIGVDDPQPVGPDSGLPPGVVSDGVDGGVEGVVGFVGGSSPGRVSDGVDGGVAGVSRS